MSKARIATTPNLADSSPAHQAALAAGDDHFRAWQYNVADHFKDKTVEQIRATLKETAHPFAVLFENLIGDFNIATGMRNANAMNAREVFYLGDKKLDRRGMQGVQNYSDITWLSTMEEVLALKDRYVFVGVDNVPGSVPINTYLWSPNSLMVFGSEGVGLTPTMQSLCRDLVHIPQYGSVRSLNVGTASGIAMHDFVSKFHEA